MKFTYQDQERLLATHLWWKQMIQQTEIPHYIVGNIVHDEFVTSTNLWRRRRINPCSEIHLDDQPLQKIKKPNLSKWL